MLAEFDLTGQVALVTGGNGGIGRSIALGLARAGAGIVIAARDTAKTTVVVGEITALGRRALGVHCDITRAEDRTATVEMALECFGTLSVLVNNAGTARFSLPEAHPEADWDAALDTNLTAMFRLCQQVYPALVTRGGGKIINVGSGYSIVPNVSSVSYAVSKGGVVQLTRTLASAWAKDNIQVNAILPGLIRTEMIAASLENPERVQFLHSRVPATRVGEPEELAGLAVLLASRASDYITGQAIAIDGGVTTADPLRDYLQLRDQRTGG